MSSIKDLEHGVQEPVVAPKTDDCSLTEKQSSEEEREIPLEPKYTGPPLAEFPEGGTRAWLVVAGCAGVLFCNFGYANAFGVYQQYYSTHQLSDQTPAAVSWIGSIQIFLLFGGGLFGGPLFDRYGVKVMYLPLVSYLFSVFMTSLCTKLWQFMLCQGILGGVSMGMSMGPAMAACGHWFRKKRGAAIGLAIGGSSLGGVIFPIALSKMLHNPHLSFGWTVRILGFLMLAITIPSAFALKARLPPRKGQFFILKAFKEPLYVTIVACQFCLLMGLFTPFFYIPSFAVSNGMSPTLAGYLVAILNGASFFGRVVPGILADKIGPLNMLTMAALSTGLLIFCWQVITTNVGIIIFSVFYGFCSGAIVSLNTFALSTVPKNPQNIGTYMGMAMSLSGLAALIGPPVNGALVTRFGGYSQTANMSGAFVMAGALGLFFARHLKGQGFWAKL